MGPLCPETKQIRNSNVLGTGPDNCANIVQHEPKPPGAETKLTARCHPECIAFRLRVQPSFTCLGNFRVIATRLHASFGRKFAETWSATRHLVVTTLHPRAHTHIHTTASPHNAHHTHSFAHTRSQNDYAIIPSPYRNMPYFR